MPRHISSVVPSPQTTYFSGWPSNAGSRSRSSCSWWQVTRTCRRRRGAPARSRLAPWSSKFHSGMSSTSVASGVPGLASILIHWPSRCMWPAAPRMVIDRGIVRVHDVVSRRRRRRCRTAGAAGWPAGRCPRRTAPWRPRRTPRGRTAAPGRAPAGTAARRAPGGGWCGRRRGPSPPSASSGSGSTTGPGASPVEQVVVHLHDDPRAAVERDAVARRATASRAPPGAQAPSQAASSTLLNSPSRPMPPKQVQPSLGRLARPWPRPRRPRPVDPEQDHVVHDLGVAGQDLGAGEPGVLGQLRVEQEAAVVVGALAGRRRGRVRRGIVEVVRCSPLRAACAP